MNAARSESDRRSNRPIWFAGAGEDETGRCAGAAAAGAAARFNVAATTPAVTRAAGAAPEWRNTVRFS